MQHFSGMLEGIIARRRISAGAGGVPPVASTSFGTASTANLNSFSINGVTTPANTRGVVATFGSFLEFFVNEPQNVTAVTCSYGGSPMTRIDGFDNQFFLNRFHMWSFALLSPSTIPASGSISFQITLSSGALEIQTGSALMVTHDSDLVLTALDEDRLTAKATSLVNSFVHDTNSLLVSLSGFKGNQTISGDPGNGWTEQDRRQALGSNALTAGSILVETKPWLTPGVDTHTTTSPISDFASGAVYQLRGV